jgi:hypothetical protein
MKTLLSLAISLLALSATTHLHAQGCADTSNIYKFSYHGKHYEIVKEMKTWDSAAACAVRRGGYLVQINSQQEQDSIYYAITHGAAISSAYTTVIDGGGIAYVWIGATDKHMEGKWLWDGNNDTIGINFWNGQGTAGAGGGSAVAGAYIHWGGTTAGTPNEPDNYMGVQNSAAIGLASWPYGIAGEWNDINANNTLYYVIEYDITTAINDLQTPTSINEVILYPNPAINIVNIRNNNPAIGITLVTLSI